MFYVLGKDQSIQVENGPLFNAGDILDDVDLRHCLETQPLVVVIACKDEDTADRLSGEFQWPFNHRHGS